MGRSTTMEKRGHHICRLINYEVRQKITKPTVRKFGGGKEETLPGNVEVMIYKKKKKLKDGFKSIEKAAQECYNIVKKEGTAYCVSKKLIKRYNLT